LGCNSVQQVQDDCDSITATQELISCETYSISPNPNSGIVNVRFKINEHDLVILNLYEISGVKVKQLANEQKLPGEYELEVDLSELHAGIYFLRLQVGEQVIVKILIKK